MQAKNILFIILLFPVASCTETLSEKQIMQYVWKVGQPCGLGDVLIFENAGKTFVKNDTIFKMQQPLAKIVKKSFNRFTEDVKISVVNIQYPLQKDTCIYHAK